MARLQKKLCPRSAADIALKNKLFVSGWQLSRTLADVRKWNYCDRIILAYEDNIPVGVAVRNANNNCVQVFVKKAYRLKGIGSKLVKAIQKDLGKLKGGCGIDGSLEFYRKLDVEIY